MSAHEIWLPALPSSKAARGSPRTSNSIRKACSKISCKFIDLLNLCAFLPLPPPFQMTFSLTCPTMYSTGHSPYGYKWCPDRLEYAIQWRTRKSMRRSLHQASDKVWGSRTICRSDSWTGDTQNGTDKAQRDGCCTVPEHSPAISGAECEESWSKVTSRVDGIACE